MFGDCVSSRQHRNVLTSRLLSLASAMASLCALALLSQAVPGVLGAADLALQAHTARVLHPGLCGAGSGALARAEMLIPASQGGNSYNPWKVRMNFDSETEAQNSSAYAPQCGESGAPVRAASLARGPDSDAVEEGNPRIACLGFPGSDGESLSSPIGLRTLPASLHTQVR